MTQVMGVKQSEDKERVDDAAVSLLAKHGIRSSWLELKGRFIWTLPREGEGGQTDHCPHFSDITPTRPFFKKDLFSQQIYIVYFIHQSCPWERRNVWNYCFCWSWSLMWLLLQYCASMAIQAIDKVLDGWWPYGLLPSIWFMSECQIQAVHF